MTRRASRLGLSLAAALLALAPGLAAAHVGSSDAVQDGQAGPYHLLVTIRPPDVVPGIAHIDVRVLDDGVRRVSVVPLPMRGPGADSPPVADEARPSADDPRLYTSAVWLMRTGAWQIRITADGDRGAGVLAVPVPALARTVRPLPRGLGVVLVLLLALLVVGAIAIVGAGLREADLAPGDAADGRRRRRGRRAMVLTAAILALAIFGGRRWWTGEASLYRRLVYKPMQVEVTRPASDRLALALTDPGWLKWRQTDDLVPDHGHLMHLFLVRAPNLDAIAHLHPRRDGEATFAQAAPPLPVGSYRLFGDIVHRSGLDETVTSTVDFTAGSPELAPPPALDDARFDGDDVVAVIPRAATAAAPTYGFGPGRGGLRWLDPRPPRAGETVLFQVEAVDDTNQPAAEIEPYMGMAGHAMIVARDFSVFVHIHPTGSIPMGALALVEGAGVVDHAHHHGMRFGPRVSFPCVFPRTGDYRVFVQVKRDGRVETAAFDLTVAPAAAATRS